MGVADQVRACRRCPLGSSCKSPVPFSGPVPAHIAVIGEAPGRQEDDAGQPFIGPAGQVARTGLLSAGIDPDSVAWLNVVSCFPNRTPTELEVRECWMNLHDQLEVITPSFCLLFGGVAVSAWWQNVRIGEVRGRWWKLDGIRGGRQGTSMGERPWAMATWHPAAILRNRGLHKEMMADIAEFARVANMGRVLTMAGHRVVVPVSPLCLKCREFGDVFVLSTGEVVTEVAGERSDGALAFCSKHFAQREGRAGGGRTGGKRAGKGGKMVATRTKERVKVEDVRGQLF